jgi:hypothetical protein
MIWRLMASVIALTDAGSVAVTTDHTDWPTQQACEHIIATLYTGPPTITVGGVNLSLRMKATCVPVGDGPVDYAAEGSPGWSPRPPAPPAPPRPTYFFR